MTVCCAPVQSSLHSFQLPITLQVMAKRQGQDGLAVASPVSHCKSSVIIILINIIIKNNNYYYVIIVIIISSSSNSFHLRHAAPSHREAQQPVSKHLAVCAESVSSDE